MTDIRRLIRKVVPMPLYRQGAYALNIRAWLRKEGYATWRQTWPYDGREITLSLRSLEHPFTLQRVRSHVGGITQNVLRCEYDRFLPQDPKVIVDAGGFIGDLACHWATKFPAARIVVIEPNPDNYKFVKRNIEPYGDRITLLNKGLWSRAARLKVEGDEMESHVVETTGDDFDVDATDVPSILATCGGRIDVLKLDIEGAEAEVLGPGAQQWIDRVGFVVVETHGPQIEADILQRMAGFGFQANRYRNLISFTRP
jgi:FkbM family methyltransferase